MTDDHGFGAGLEAGSMPGDLFGGMDAAEPAVVWRTLEGNERQTVAKKIDLLGRLAAEERVHGRQGYVERVAARIEDAGALQTIGAAVKIFDLYRRPEPDGFGWSRDRVSDHKLPRLRAFAQNADWALKNRERVENLLDEPQDVDGELRLLNEGELRRTVHEAKRAAVEGEPEVRFVDLRLRFDERSAQEFRQIAQALVTKHALDGQAFSDHEGTRLAQAVKVAMGEWLGAEYDIEGENGELVVVRNIDFLPGGAHGRIDPSVVLEDEPGAG